MDLLEIFVQEYSARPELAALRIVGTIGGILLANKFAEYAKRRKGKTLGKSLRYISYSFYVVAHVPFIQFLSVLPFFPWDTVVEITFLIFVVTALYSTKYLVKTLNTLDRVRKI